MRASSRACSARPSARQAALTDFAPSAIVAQHAANACRARWRRSAPDGPLPDYPLGSDFTPVEQRLVKALGWLKANDRDARRQAAHGARRVASRRRAGRGCRGAWHAWSSRAGACRGFAALAASQALAACVTCGRTCVATPCTKRVAPSRLRSRADRLRAPRPPFAPTVKPKCGNSARPEPRRRSCRCRSPRRPGRRTCARNR